MDNQNNNYFKDININHENSGQEWWCLQLNDNAICHYIIKEGKCERQTHVQHKVFLKWPYSELCTCRCPHHGWLCCLHAAGASCHLGRRSISDHLRRLAMKYSHQKSQKYHANRKIDFLSHLIGQVRFNSLLLHNFYWMWDYVCIQCIQQLDNLSKNIKLLNCCHLHPSPQGHFRPLFKKLCTVMNEI